MTCTVFAKQQTTYCLTVRNPDRAIEKLPRAALAKQRASAFEQASRLRAAKRSKRTTRPNPPADHG